MVLSDLGRSRSTPEQMNHRDTENTEKTRQEHLSTLIFTNGGLFCVHHIIVQVSED